MHEGIAERVFDSVGEIAAPVRLIHDGITHRVYAGLGGALASAVRAGARAISLRRPPEAPSIERAPAGRVAIGALNGAFGDRLEREHSPLAVRMTVRRGGQAVDLDVDSVRAAFPDATARLVVFMHGLCETEGAWALWSRRHVPYGPRLRVELGYTPVYIRYNSGRHVSDNGRDLARLLDELTSVWPVPPEEIALIAAPATRVPGGRGLRWCVTCSCSAAPTWVPRSSGPPMRRAPRWRGCPRPNRWPPR